MTPNSLYSNFMKINIIPNDEQIIHQIQLIMIFQSDINAVLITINNNIGSFYYEWTFGGSFPKPWQEVKGESLA